MKKLLYIFALSSLVWSCGGGDTPPAPAPIPTVNNAPTVPTLASPTNNLLCIDNVVEFNWNASTDSDGDGITYLIEVAKNNQFSPIDQSFSGSSITKTITLEKGIAYYWRVKATDSKSLSSAYSSVFNFYTEGDGVVNYLPFSPELVAPELNSIETGAPKTLTLQWSASDVDTTDTLTYDVFFGTDSTPITLMGDNQTATNLDVSIIASTSYYWKVVVKDGQGGQTIGQTWNFTTD